MREVSCFLSRESRCDFRADGKPDRAHLIPLQRIKRARNPEVPEDQWWDPRVIVPLCRAHHHKFDNGFIKIARDDLAKTGVEEFAIEFGLSWSLDRDYE